MASVRGERELTDLQLLEHFTAERQETAFAALVQRHGPMVLGVCRRILRRAEDAEDAFQATFLALARQARSVGKQGSVGGWLYRVAYRIAMRAKVNTVKRKARDRAACRSASSATSAETAWKEVRPVLDEELDRLPEKYRLPVVLCYLEGKSYTEAARELGWTKGTVSGRLAQARELLRQRLTRRGVVLSAGLLGTVLSSDATGAAVPTALGAKASQTAVSIASGNALAGLVSSRVAALAKAATETLAMGKLKTGALVALVLSVLTAGAGLMAHQPVPAEPGPTQQAAAPPAPTPKAHDPRKAHADLYGDPLPPGALVRMGTRRLCGSMDPMWAAFSPDGAKIASQSWYGVTVWETASGRTLVERTDYRSLVNCVGWRADGTGIAIVRLPDGSFFVSAFTDVTEKLPARAQAAAPPGQPGPDGLHPLALSADATRLALARKPGEEQFTIDILPATPGRMVADLIPERTLGPYPGPCREIRYTAGGLVYLSGPWTDKEDWTITVIDPEKKTIKRTVRIPPPAYCVWRHMLSLSADARLAAIPTRAKRATNEHESVIRVWDLVEGKELCKLPFPQCGYGIGHAFTSDGKRLITSTNQIYFQVWDLATGKETVRCPLPCGPFHGLEGSAVAVSPDDKRFATARRDGRIEFWDTATGKAVGAFASHRDIVEAVAVSPDGRLAATCGYDGLVRVWELATGKSGCVIPAPLSREPRSQFWSKLGLTFSPDGSALLFTAKGKLALADSASGKRLDLPDKMGGCPGNVGGFAAAGTMLATFADNVVTLWELPTGTARVRVTIPLALVKAPGLKERLKMVTVNSAVLSADGKFLFTNSIRWDADPTTGADQNAKDVWDAEEDWDANDVWDARTGRRLHRLIVPRTQYPRAAFDPTSRVMYLGGVSVDLPARGRRMADALTARDPVAGTLLRRFADSDPGPPLRGDPRIEDRIRAVQAVAVSPDGRLLAAAEGPFTSDRAVYIYETLTGRLIKRLVGHVRPVTDLAFTPDSRRLVSVSEDQTGLVWDVTVPALGANKAYKELAEVWDSLAAPDPGLGYAVMAALVAAPAEAIPLLRARLRPPPVPTEADLDRLVSQLDADAFTDRAKASAELERFGPNAVAGVRERLKQTSSKEVRRRLTQFLTRYDGTDPSPYHIRCVHGVAVLEAIGSAEARKVLATLAKESGDDLLTREAKAALERLGPK
jgi:RNA polymerase sigma factor (sigma-70 family)